MLFKKGKGIKHPKTLWRDEQLFPSDLEGGPQDIFEIIMPWVAEQAEDEKKLKASAKKASGNKSTGKQASLSAFFKPSKSKATSADVDMTAGATGDGDEEEETKGAAKEVTNLDEEEKLAYLSKVVKSGSVETFNWEYTDRDFKLGRNK